MLDDGNHPIADHEDAGANGVGRIGGNREADLARTPLDGAIAIEHDPVDGGCDSRGAVEGGVVDGD